MTLERGCSTQKYTDRAKHTISKRQSRLVILRCGAAPAEMDWQNLTNKIYSQSWACPLEKSFWNQQDQILNHKACTIYKYSFNSCNSSPSQSYVLIRSVTPTTCLPLRFKFPSWTEGAFISPSGFFLLRKVVPRDTHIKLLQGGPACNSASSAKRKVSCVARTNPILGDERGSAIKS
jgi:hypothetical protein